MIISLLAFVFSFSMIVLVHELGHFIVARRSGVKVYEFSIGFPISPRLCTLFRHKETEFTIRLLPLGGFVSFSKDGNEDSIELFSASYFKRAMIMSAGSLSNISFAFILFIPVFIIGKNLHFLESVLLSAQTVWEIISGTLIFLGKMLSGHGGMTGVAGPVGIATMAGQAASKGFINLCYFTGILSMSLGIMNLIPFPALDGGQLLMLLIEKIKRKPINLKIHQMVNLIGLMLFILLSIVMTYKDIIKLIA